MSWGDIHDITISAFSFLGKPVSELKQAAELRGYELEINKSSIITLQARPKNVIIVVVDENNIVKHIDREHESI